MIASDELAVHQAGGRGGELLAAQLELGAPALFTGPGVREVLIRDALCHGVELVEGAHTILRLHQTSRP